MQIRVRVRLPLRFRQGSYRKALVFEPALRIIANSHSAPFVLCSKESNLQSWDRAHSLSPGYRLSLRNLVCRTWQSLCLVRTRPGFLEKFLSQNLLPELPPRTPSQNSLPDLPLRTSLYDPGHTRVYCIYTNIGIIHIYITYIPIRIQA